MLISYLRSLSGKERNATANRHLALCLAFIAGAINANGFFAVQRYTANMTGIVTTLADSLILGKTELLISGLCALIFFMLGACCSILLIYRGTQRALQSEFALPFMIEACLLFFFSLLGDSLQAYPMLFVPITVTLLCFIMGLQNATITKMTNSQIRTTHVTGLITDLGIEIGKRFCLKLNKTGSQPFSEQIDYAKLWLLVSLLIMFFTGGIIGSLGFIYAGFTSIWPLAVLLAVIAAAPILEDLGLLNQLQQ